MALIKLTDFEQLVASYVPFVGQALDFQREKEVQKALTALYDESDALAVLVVQEIAAFLWWAYHIGAAAADALYYSSQVQAAINKANTNTLEAWQQWLTVKYPADLRALYDALSTEISNGNKANRKQTASDLKKLEAEIAALEKWKRVTVTPDLKTFGSFLSTWKTTYLPPLRTLILWLKSPKTFAAWALPPLIVQMPTTLRRPGLLLSSTAIENALMATWINDPNVVLDNVLQWLVTSK